MARYVARRLLLLLPAWLIMGSVAFALIRLIPGDPAAVLLGMEATPQAKVTSWPEKGVDPRDRTRVGYLLPFEIVSVLLLVAMVGVILLSKKDLK